MQESNILKKLPQEVDGNEIFHQDPFLEGSLYKNMVQIHEHCSKHCALNNKHKYMLFYTESKEKVY